jgi:hypothetical protein
MIDYNKPKYVAMAAIYNAAETNQKAAMVEALAAYDSDMLVEVFALLDLGVGLQNSLRQTAKMTGQVQDLPEIARVKKVLVNGKKAILAELTARRETKAD